jgi:hypothetical protein
MSLAQMLQLDPVTRSKVQFIFEKDAPSILAADYDSQVGCYV